MTRSSDPLDDALAADARADDRQAGVRAQRVHRIANAVIDELVSAGDLPAKHAADATIRSFHIIADCLYGNATIDIPPMTRRPGGA
jgi:hypothetical protein